MARSLPLPPAREAGHRGLPATTAAELLHQLRQLGVLLDQSIHFGEVGPGASGNPPPAGALEDRRIAALAPRHRPEYLLGPTEVAAIDGLLGLPGQPGQPGEPPHQLTP